MNTAIVWFRNDLRLQDNPALSAAQAGGFRVLPVYIDEREQSAPTAASWWDHHALADLSHALVAQGGQLHLAQGDALMALERWVEESGAVAVFWNRRYTPDTIDADTRIKTALKARGVGVHSCNGALLHEPWQVLNLSGKPYRVFTPYWRKCLEIGLPELDQQAEAVVQWSKVQGSMDLSELQLLSDLDWDAGFGERWRPTRAEGLAFFEHFKAGPLESYDADRDRPDRRGTTSLSPYLRSGLIGVREVVALLQSPGWLAQESVEQAHGRRKLLAELGWREFSYYLMYHFPHCVDQPLQAKFEHFPWQRTPDLIQAWREGLTGYPIVDAGMMELWHSGWMHNRVRMIVASFLVKHLLQPWQEGADWFMQTLVDADLASNTQGWQWTAGCGADASPYFRVFNPVSQGKKFDPQGEYVRRWLPALADVPDKFLQEPWTMDAITQATSKCIIGEDYPAPIVDLKAGRERALEAWQSIRE